MGVNEKHAATYHGGEYTPDIDELRDVWVDYLLNPLPRSQGIPLVPVAQAEFDRWLETVRAEAKAEALNEYADTLGYRISGAIRKYGQAQGDFRDIIQELRARANQYKEQS